MVKRTIVGAHYGLRDWLLQRITAVMMAIYALFIAGYVLLHPALDYDTWTALFSGSLMRSFSLLCLLALFAHAWVGVRDIVMDYVKSASVRLLLHVLVILALLMYAIWSVQILWGM